MTPSAIDLTPKSPPITWEKLPDDFILPDEPVDNNLQPLLAAALRESLELAGLILESFLHFPLPPQVLSMSDANWGPQDASITKSTMELPLFASRSMSAYFIDLLGPIHWLSKRQSVTAGSSAEAEIYATDECVKFLLELVQTLEFLGVKDVFMPTTTTVFNDNMACVNWAKCSTTKGLRHIQMKENHVLESVLSNFVTIKYIDGKINLADIFTKEMKDVGHFVVLCDLVMCSRLAT